MTFGRAFLILGCLFVPLPGAFVLMALAAASNRSDTRTLARALLSALALLVLLLIALRVGYGPSSGGEGTRELPPRLSQVSETGASPAQRPLSETAKSCANTSSAATVGRVGLPGRERRPAHQVDHALEGLGASELQQVAAVEGLQGSPHVH
jgi:hypothetical protein